MPSLFDLCDEKSRKKIAVLIEEAQAEEKVKTEKMLKEREEEHIRTHIFKTYEESLNYLKDNPGETIWFHTNILSFDTEENKFISFEQDFDLDGVCCYDVFRHYTYEELIDSVNRHREYMEKNFPRHKNGYLDERGFLQYVHI